MVQPCALITCDIRFLLVWKRAEPLASGMGLLWKLTLWKPLVSDCFAGQLIQVNILYPHAWDQKCLEFRAFQIQEIFIVSVASHKSRSKMFQNLKLPKKIQILEHFFQICIVLVSNVNFLRLHKIIYAAYMKNKGSQAVWNRRITVTIF